MRHREHEAKVGAGREVIMTTNEGNKDAIVRLTRAEE